MKMLLILVGVMTVICGVGGDDSRTITIGAVLSAEQYGEAFAKAIDEANSGEGALPLHVQPG